MEKLAEKRRWPPSSRGSGPATRFKTKLVLVYLSLGAFNLGAWMWALSALQDRPLLLSAALAVYGLGLRHALDADHIAAIDNVTRRMMQAGSRPVSVGLFFAFGHSAMVVVVTAALASSTSALEHIARYRDAGAWIGTSISAGFLILVGTMNLLIFASVYRAIRRQPEDGHESLAPPAVGALARMLAPLLKLVDRSWLMFPLGFLFGLGFDTATEVALFGLSAAHASDGLPLGTVMVFPALFAAGMALVDTTDGVVMVGAYDWALLNPRRKQYYNLAITALSVAVAFCIAALQIASMLRTQLSVGNGLREAVEWLTDSMNSLGVLIVGLFLACWLISALAHRDGHRSGWG